MLESSAGTAFEARLQAVEDRLEILNLIALHPPSADTAADYFAQAAYTEDGVWERGPEERVVGNKAVGAFMRTPAHRATIAGGLAHFCGLPHVQVEGDEAFVTSYLQILVPDAEGKERPLANHGVSRGYRIHRVVANRWTLVRTPEGWRIRSRVFRPLDGTQPARDILAQALQPFMRTI